jgi:hypothetical protein
MQKISYGVLTLIFIFGAVVSFATVPNFADAALISKTNPITLHITDSRFTDTAVTARQNLLQGAFQQGGAAAQQQMQANLNNGNIQIAKDAQSAWDDSTSYLSFEGKKVGGNGKQGVQDGFKKILGDPNNLPPDPAKQVNKTICIVPRPGQNEAYGPLTDKPFPIEGKVRDVVADHPITEGHITDESQLNFDLRKLGSQKWEQEKTTALASPPEKGTQKLAANPPSSAQAQEYVASMGGNPTTRGSYTIGGTKVPVGQYEANVTNDRTGIVFDESCENPKQGGKVPEPGTPGGQALGGAGSESGFGDVPGGSGGSGGGSGGGGGGLGGGGSGLGSLGALLPLMLMQSLLGGQQGAGQGQGGQGAGTGTGTTTNCASQGVYPVCGTDGITYNNVCWLQQVGVTQKSTGVCASVSPTPVVSPTPRPDLSTIVTQLISSGVPQSVINSILSSISSIFNHPTGDATIQ